MGVAFILKVEYYECQITYIYCRKAIWIKHIALEANTLRV